MPNTFSLPYDISTTISPNIVWVTLPGITLITSSQPIESSLDGISGWAPLSGTQQGVNINPRFIRVTSGSAVINCKRVNKWNPSPVPATYASLIARDGAVAYWRLGETSGTIATDSIGSAHGTISGGVTLNQVGAIGDKNGAMGFDVATFGQINAGNAQVGNFGAGSYTIEAWIKTPGGIYQTVASKTDNANVGWRAFIGAANLLTLYWGSDTQNYTGSTLPISLNVWHHVIWGFDVATLSVFYAVDGVYQSVVGQTAHPVNNTDSILIGASLGAYFFNGLIDEVAIYKTALTPAQILSHYKARLADIYPVGSYPDRVIKDGASAYWRLGETTGTTAIDVIGGANGTISGGVTLGQSGAMTDGNKAMLFNGVDGKIAIASGFNPPIFSIEAWIKTTNSAHVPVWSQRNLSEPNDYCINIFQGKGLFFTVSTGLQGNIVISDGVWHHMVCTYDGTTKKIYIDGNLDNQQTFSFSIVTLSPSIGYDSDTSLYFDGLIDEVAIYPVALTAQQILKHYQAR